MLSKEDVLLWIHGEIENASNKLVTMRSIRIEDVIKLQERIATLKTVRDTINKLSTKED